MNVANLELCKELYELSGWLSRPLWTKWHCGELIFGKGKEKFTGEWHVVETPCWLDKTEVPAYDAGFLLRKLPDGVSLYKGRRGWTLNSGNTFQLNNSSTGNVLRLGNFLSATPENALCKLAIELHKQGVLKKGIGDE